MALIKHNLPCPTAEIVIERKHRHRFRLVERLEFEGRPCVRVLPLDRGFEDYRGAIWPMEWVYLPGDQLEMFGNDDREE